MLAKEAKKYVRVHNRLTATLARLEQDEGVALAERIRQLTETRCELDERVSPESTSAPVFGNFTNKDW
jgi:hypothetical protein